MQIIFSARQTYGDARTTQKKHSPQTPSLGPFMFDQKTAAEWDLEHCRTIFIKDAVYSCTHGVVSSQDTLLRLGSPVPNIGSACLGAFIHFSVIHGQKFASNSYYWTTRFSGSSCYANNSRKTTESILYVMPGGMMTVSTIIITMAKVETTIY